jgi:hypothetical protein
LQTFRNSRGAEDAGVSKHEGAAEKWGEEGGRKSASFETRPASAPQDEGADNTRGQEAFVQLERGRYRLHVRAKMLRNIIMIVRRTKNNVQPTPDVKNQAQRTAHERWRELARMRAYSGAPASFRALPAPVISQEFATAARALRHDGARERKA